MNLVNKLIDEWNALGTPVEARLAEALSKLERCHAERVELQQKIHRQRVMLRENWQTIEMRASNRRAWYPSKLLGAILNNRVKRNVLPSEGNK